MKIIKIQGREIYDSAGWPTLECQITLENGAIVTASVPHGTSRSRFEAYELRDGGKRLSGNGVQKAVEVIEDTIAPALVGQLPNIIDIDKRLLELDGTEDKRKLGANTILAVSIATVRAQALCLQRELYELIAHLIGSQTVTLPFPLFNMFSGGQHTVGELAIQEFLILPVGLQNFNQAMESSVTFYHTLQKLLYDKGYSVLTSIEGAFAPDVHDETELLDLLLAVIEKLSDRYTFKIGLDVAASHFYDAEKQIYLVQNKKMTREELIAWYKKLMTKYPIYSIEDGIAQDDWKGWQLLMQELGSRTLIVGDDLFATNPMRLWHGIETKSANAAIIKPNQIGTVTQTLQAVQLCQDYGLNMVISHRSCETNDSFIADLAAGVSAGQIKAGPPVGGERLAKYNRLLAIEEQLELFLLDS
jgi:enolase